MKGYPYYRNFRVRIQKTNGSCRYHKKVGEELDFEYATPSNLCMHAFHVVYPYYLTLLNGGWFRWVGHDKGVVVQCPNPNCSLVMQIGRRQTVEGATIVVEVIGRKGECPRGHRIGQLFDVKESSLRLCPRLFDAIYPYVNLLSFGQRPECLENEVLIRCPNPSCGVIAKLFLVAQHEG